MSNLQKPVIFIGVAILLLFIFGIIFSFAFIRNYFESGTSGRVNQVAVDVVTPTSTPTPAVLVTEFPITATPVINPVSDSVKIYLVVLGDNGQSGQKIGCGDSLVAVERKIAPTAAPLRAALSELLSIKQQNLADLNLYNSLYQSDLQIDSVTVDSGGTATIKLIGKMQLGGTCDSPRFENQLKATALQFATVKKADITINGTPIEQAVSTR